MSRHHRHRHDDRSARRHILRAQLEDVQAQRPLLRRLYARWLPSRVSAAFEAVFAYIWKATLGRLVVAKLHLSRDAARAEAAALRLVRASTRVPVPRVYAVLPWFGDHYLLMSRMRGTELADVWTQLPDVAKDAVADQLRGFLIELRALRSPFGSAICSPTGERLHDPRLPAKHRGPFADEDAFNYVLRYFEPLHNLPPAVQDSHARVHDIVFTHGDIMPRNVLVDAAAPARVVALLDWDSAGWFPTHWEYRKARWTAAGELEETWVPRLGRIVEPFPDEADADDYLSRRFWAPS